MRAPKRKRPLRRAIDCPKDIDLSALSARVAYFGSPEHKQGKTYAGYPKPRADASQCPKKFNRSPRGPLKWLRAALESGHVGAPWEQGLPRYVWFYDKEDHLYYEARLSNAGNGTYKGYPLNEDELPSILKETLHAGS